MHALSTRLRRLFLRASPRRATPHAPVVLVDVFDTVLIRRLGSPESMLRGLGRLLSQESKLVCGSDVFVASRRHAESQAHRNGGAEYIATHEDIFRELGAALQREESEWLSWMRSDLDLEESLSASIPAMLETIEDMRRRGSRIVFVSDMYLPSSFIKMLLARCGAFQDGDKCYVSCEAMASKRTGALFDHVLEKERVPREEVVHFGNDKHADIRGAEKAGLRAVSCEIGNFNRYELLLENSGHKTGNLTSALAGASRLVRLRVDVANEHEEVLRDITAGVLAPALVGFLLWLMGRARANKIERLYFMSREGQVLLEVAKKLVPRLEVECELKYLYASRQTWCLAALSARQADQDMNWIWTPNATNCVASLFARIGGAAEDFLRELEGGGFAESTWREPMSPAEWGLLREKLQSDRKFVAYVGDRASRLRELTMAYVDQEGLLKDAAGALVDIGWNGSMQRALTTLLTGTGESGTLGLYFGLLKKIAPTAGETREAYFFNEWDRTGMINFMPRNGMFFIMEGMCAADHGTVIDYDRRDGRVEPVLREPGNPQLESWGLGIIRRSIELFAEEMVLDPKLVDLRADVRPACAEALHTLWTQPTRAEAKALSMLPWEQGLGRNGDYASMRIAPPYVYSDLWRRNKQYYRRPWPEGSRRVTAQPLAAAVGAIHATKSVLKRIGKRLDRKKR